LIRKTKSSEKQYLVQRVKPCSTSETLFNEWNLVVYKRYCLFDWFIVACFYQN